jgi:DNA polymerase-3 subunit gamma/tau
VQQNWAKIKQIVRKRIPMTEGLLNSARSIVLKGDTLVLGFQSEVVKSKMETAENIDLLRQALKSVLGATLGVRCTVVGGKSSSPADLDVDGDGMVGTALDLGGKIAYEE